MKYIYILGLILLICILYSYNIKEGNSNLSIEDRKIDLSKNDFLDYQLEIVRNIDDNILTDVNTLEEKIPSEYHIKQRKCNELSICDQLKKEEYEDCGYCLADEFDISKPYSFHWGGKGGAYSRNSNCYHNGNKYTERGGVKKRNVEWVAPSSTNTNTRIGMGSFEKCKEIKTKHTCEKQKQCNFLTGKEANIDKELNCGWCLDKTSDVGGNPFVRNISNDPNDLKKVKANLVERLFKSGYEMKCTPTIYHKNEIYDGSVWPEGGSGYNSMMPQCENLTENSCKNSRQPWIGRKSGHYDARICQWREVKSETRLEKQYYCSSNQSRKKGENDITDDELCKSSKIEKENWNTIEFPKFESKNGKCNKDLIKQSDCSIFLKESCMKKSYDPETGKETQGPFMKDKTNCIKDLWVDIGFYEENFQYFENGKYKKESVNGDVLTADQEIREYMKKWKGANNFGEIQKSMIKLAKEKIHSKDFYTTKKWNKILLNRNVCSEAFDTEKNKISPNTELECVNPCYKYQIDGTEWENTPKECQVKIFERNGGQEKGLAHPIKQSGKMPSVLQFFEGFNINEGFTTRDIEKSSIIKDGDGLISLNNDSLKGKSIKEINSIYEKIQNIEKKPNNEVSFEKKYKAHLQLNGEVPREGIDENKLCWVEFVKIMRTYPGTKIGNTYQHITINDKMKNNLGDINVSCYGDTVYCNTPYDGKKYKDNSIEAYLKIVQGNTNNWELEKKTYEDPAFDFRPWNKVINDYWKEGENWDKFMHLMMKQENIKLHFAYSMKEEENKRKIEISEKSPFYNLINSDTCKYSKNMFLLKFYVKNLGSGATLYIKNKNYQQKVLLFNGENEILLHPNLYNGTKIELIPLVKSILFIENAKLIRIRGEKHTYKLKDYKKTSSCDNVWNYCYWDSSFSLDNSAINNTNLTPTETKPKMKYLLNHHRTSIDFTKFFGLINNDDFIDLKYKSLEPEMIKTKREINIEIMKHQNTINRQLTPTSERKDTKFELKITAKDQNWGWRTSRIELEGNSTKIFGIGGKYNSSTGNGKNYNQQKKYLNDNVTKISSDITNNVVNNKKNGGKVKMDLKYYTSYSGHETYIDNANLSVKNTPDNKNQNINLLNGIPGNRIKVKGKIQRRRKIPEKLKWVTIQNGKPQIDSDSYTYKLTGKGADQGWGYSSSKIHGSNLTKHRAKSQLFNWRNKVSKTRRPLSERWENINLSGKINQHNTDKTIKIESETSQTGGHETYIKDLKLNILKNNRQLSGSLLKNKKISINGNVSKDLRQGTNIKIWEGFQNNESIENIIIDKLDNIKNYFFPEKEGFVHSFFQPHLYLKKKKKKKKIKKIKKISNPFRFIFKTQPVTCCNGNDDCTYSASTVARRNAKTETACAAANGKWHGPPNQAKLKKGARITFKGKDQGWGTDCNAHLSVNGKKSKKFGKKLESYTINLDDKIKTTSNTFNVKLHKYGYPGCEVHVEDTKIEIKNPSDIKTQNSTKTYDIGNHSVTNRSGGKVIFKRGTSI